MGQSATKLNMFVIHLNGEFMELWKTIPQYEGYYEASTKGRVRSVNRKTKHPRNSNMALPRRGRILKSELDKSGYPVVTLSKDGKTRTFKVHRLVAMAFIPNPRSLPQIDHINCVRYDNRPINLRWCTAQDNTKWREEKYKAGDRAKYHVLCKESGRTFRSTYDAAAWVISQGLPKKTTSYDTVSKGIRTSCKTGGRSYGFHWTYLEGSTTISEESREKSRNGEPRTRRVKI